MYVCMYIHAKLATVWVNVILSVATFYYISMISIHTYHIQYIRMYVHHIMNYAICLKRLLFGMLFNTVPESCCVLCHTGLLSNGVY